jgi:sulfur relay (sulfurtransferase) DsrC/TusE family protein
MRTAAAKVWTPDDADARARAAGLGELSEKHWRVIAATRELAAHDGVCPTVEQVAQATRLTIPQIATLFAGRPADLIPEIAGIKRS